MYVCVCVLPSTGGLWGNTGRLCDELKTRMTSCCTRGLSSLVNKGQRMKKKKERE